MVNFQIVYVKVATATAKSLQLFPTLCDPIDKRVNLKSFIARKNICNDVWGWLLTRFIVVIIL